MTTPPRQQQKRDMVRHMPIRQQQHELSRHYGALPDDRVTQRDFFQLQLDLMEERCLARYSEQVNNLDQQMKSMQTAIDKAESALNTRLEGMNEIRQQLATQRADFVTTDRLESLLTLGQSDRRTFTDKISTLEALVATTANLAREQSQKDMDVMRNRTDNDFKTVNADIRSLREARSTATGSSVTSREFISYGIAIVAIIATVISRLL